MNQKELSEYAELERIAITKFFTEFSGEFPKLRMGCEDIVNPTLFVRTNLERIKESHKSREVIAAFVRLKKYRKEVERCTNLT